MNQLKKFDSAKVEMIYQNECLDRNKFRMLLFEDETFKNNYQSIIHPIIKKEVLKGIKTSKNDIIKDNKKRILFLDVPLLYEASFDELCDNVLIINAEEEVIYQRIRKRNNLSDSDIAAILRNQRSGKQGHERQPEYGHARRQRIDFKQADRYVGLQAA